MHEGNYVTPKPPSTIWLRSLPTFQLQSTLALQNSTRKPESRNKSSIVTLLRGKLKSLEWLRGRGLGRLYDSEKRVSALVVGVHWGSLGQQVRVRGLTLGIGWGGNQRRIQDLLHTRRTELCQVTVTNNHQGTRCRSRSRRNRGLGQRILCLRYGW